MLLLRTKHTFLLLYDCDIDALVACRAGEIFSSERSHRKKFSHHLEFFMQWKTGERKKVLPRGSNMAV